MWIYLPSECYHSAQELVALNWDLDSQISLLKQSVMLRSKPTTVKSLRLAWKKHSWMKRLCGRILKPSMASRGVGSWIASQVVSPASPLASQERNLPTKTQGTYGQTSGVLSVKSDQKCASSKMSQTCYDWDLKKSQMTCEQWAMQLRQVCLQRKKSVQRIRESDCLSWPTPIASDATVGSDNRKRRHLQANLYRNSTQDQQQRQGRFIWV